MRVSLYYRAKPEQIIKVFVRCRKLAENSTWQRENHLPSSEAVIEWPGGTRGLESDRDLQPGNFQFIAVAQQTGNLGSQCRTVDPGAVQTAQIGNINQGTIVAYLDVAA